MDHADALTSWPPDHGVANETDASPGRLHAITLTGPAGRMETVFSDPYILLTNEKISKVQDLMPVLEKVRPTGQPLVVVAENMDGPALGMLVANNVHETFRSVVVRHPASATAGSPSWATPRPSSVARSSRVRRA